MGPLEIILILVVALIIWGPARIPEIASTLGRITRTFRKASSDLTSQLSRELQVEEKDSPPRLTTSDDDKAGKSPGQDTAEPGDTETESPRDR